MRAEDDLTYQEYKENVEDAMRYIKNHGWTPRQVTDRMTDEDNELLIGTSEALWIISIGAYEVEHDILEDNPLRQIQDSGKLIITPHIAWAPKETRERLLDGVYENIKKIL